jgi:uncharacterized protein YndB with AHSA1/START domain
MKLAQAIDWQTTSVHKPSGSGLLRLERTIAASPQRVYDAFSDPAHLAQWWGPQGFSLSTHTFAFRTGGEGGFWTLTMHTDVGGQQQDFPNHLVWDALEPGTRLRYHHVAVGSHEPMHMATDVLFEPVGDTQTRTIWTMDFGSEAARDAIDAQMMASQGGQQTTARLADHVEGAGFDETAAASGHSLTLIRDLPVSARAIYRCWTEPALVEPWFCPKPWRAVRTLNELRAGGACNTTMYGPDGEVHANDGSYLDLVPERRIVFTDMLLSDWRPNPQEGMNFTGCIELEPLSNGHTRYTARGKHRSAESRAQHAAMGFHEGWGIATDQLVAFSAARGLV